MGGGNSLGHFLDVIYEESGAAILNDFAEFHRRIAQIGMFNSLSQCLLKLTAPGVPDIFQGNELCQFSLVDPDNRRPVNYEARQALLKQLQQDVCSSSSLPELVGSWLADAESGKPKLYLTWRTLELRNKKASLFKEGVYIPLNVSGEKAQHVIAFAREYEGQTAIVVAPRLCARLLGESGNTVCDETLWGDTNVEISNSHGRCYHNVFTGECIAPRGEERAIITLAGLFRYFPASILIGEPIMTSHS